MFMSNFALKIQNRLKTDKERQKKVGDRGQNYKENLNFPTMPFMKRYFFFFSFFFNNQLDDNNVEIIVAQQHALLLKKED